MDHHRLTLPCEAADHDELWAEHEQVDGQPSYYLAVSATKDRNIQSAYLSIESARKLFNHLGVWLHTHHQQEI